MAVKGLVYIHLTLTITINYRFSMTYWTANEDKFQRKKQYGFHL